MGCDVLKLVCATLLMVQGGQVTRSKLGFFGIGEALEQKFAVFDRLFDVAKTLCDLNASKQRRRVFG